MNDTLDRSFEAIRDALLEFVTRNFMVSVEEIDLDQSMIDQGIIDSFGLIEITSFIENRFGVTVEERDMTREQFGSLHKMARFVVSRANGQP